MPAILIDLRINLTDHVVHGKRHSATPDIDSVQAKGADKLASLALINALRARSRKGIVHLSPDNGSMSQRRTNGSGVLGFRPHYRFHGVPVLLCSSLTVAVRATKHIPLQKFRSLSPYVRERYTRIPATSVAFFKETCVEDASDIELLLKSLTGRQGPWHIAYGYSSMLIRPSCPFLLASSCHIYRPLCRHCTYSSVPTVLCADVLVRNAKEDLVLQATAHHQWLPFQAVERGRCQQTWGFYHLSSDMRKVSDRSSRPLAITAYKYPPATQKGHSDLVPMAPEPPSPSRPVLIR